jgi:hypothetical protein
MLRRTSHSLDRLDLDPRCRLAERRAVARSGEDSEDARRCPMIPDDQVA